MASVRQDNIQVNLDINGQRAGQTLKEIQNEARQANRELQQLVPGTEAFVNKSRELAAINVRLNAVKTDIKDIERELGNGGNGFLEFAKKATAFAGIHIGLQEAVSFVKDFGRESIEAAAKTSDALADIQKATGLTADEVARLNDELGKIDTRTSQEDLQAIVVVGGQLGVANDQILGFTESVDKAVVALGDEFTGGAEEVAAKMGVLQKLFRETKDIDAGDSINRIGSAVNALGAAGSATGPVVADFTARIGQLGNLAPQITQTLGLGAAFQELGLTAEISAGGVTNVLLTASKDTAGFAKQIGISNEEFKKLINTNPNEVLLRLAESLKGASNSKIVQTLEGLNIKSQEATKVVSLLANQTDLVRQKQALANTEFQKGTSLTDEFNLKNTNAAAQLAKNAKVYEQMKVEVGQGLLPVFLKISSAGLTFIGVLRALPGFLRENKEIIAALGIALIALNFQQILFHANTLRSAAALRIETIAKVASKFATEGLSAAMKANPIGFIISAVALLTAGFIQLYNRSETVRAGIAGLGAVAFEVFTIIKESVGQFVDGFNKLKNGDISGGLADIGKSIVKANPVGLALTEGERLGNAFKKGYEDKVKSELKPPTVPKPGAPGSPKDPEALNDGSKDEEIISEKEKKKQERLRKQQEKADADRLKQEEAARKKLEDLEIQAIANEQARKIRAAEVAAQREKEEVNKSKATAEQKAALMKAIETKLQTDIAQINKEYADKNAIARADQEIVAAGKNQAKLLDAHISKLEIQRDIDLKNTQLTEDQKALIVAKAAADIQRLREDYAKQELELANRSAIARADLELVEAEIQARKNPKDVRANEEAILQAQISRITTLRDIDLQNTQLTEDEKKAIRQQAENDIDALREENHQREKQRQQELMDTIASLAQGGLQAISDFGKISTDKDINEAEKAKKAKVLKLKQELDAKRITKDQYDAAVAATEEATDKKTRELKRKQAQQDKAIAITNSIISGALAVIKAAPNIPLQIVTGILAGLTTAKIIATPIPEFSFGALFRKMGSGIKKLANGGMNFFRNAGVPSGPLHSDGGIDLVDNRTGARLAEMEGGEPIMVLSRSTYTNNRDIVDKLLDTSLYRGGARVKLNNGGLGGDAGLPAGESPNSAEGAAMLTLLQSIDANTRRFPTVLKAIVSLTDIQDAETLQQDIEEDSQFS